MGKEGKMDFTKLESLCCMCLKGLKPAVILAVEDGSFSQGSELGVDHFSTQQVLSAQVD